MKYVISLSQSVRWHALGHTQSHTHTHTHMHETTHTHSRTHTWTRPHTHKHTCTRPHTHTDTDTYTDTHTHTHLPAQTHVHTNAGTSTHALTLSQYLRHNLKLPRRIVTSCGRQGGGRRGEEGGGGPTLAFSSRLSAGTASRGGKRTAASNGDSLTLIYRTKQHCITITPLASLLIKPLTLMNIQCKRLCNPTLSQ
ncbi:unnamed protein product [Arctogadus glacialis]